MPTPWKCDSVTLSLEFPARGFTLSLEFLAQGNQPFYIILGKFIRLIISIFFSTKIGNRQGL